MFKTITTGLLLLTVSSGAAMAACSDAEIAAMTKDGYSPKAIDSACGTLVTGSKVQTPAPAPVPVPVPVPAPGRPWLGVQITGVDAALATTLGLPDGKGARVFMVTPGSPAAKAGLQVPDVMLEFDGKPIEQMQQLPLYVSQTPPGKTVMLKVWRDHAVKVIPAQIEVMAPSSPPAPAAR